MVFQNNLLMGAAGAASGSAAYTVDYSCRFNDNDSAYFSRTSATPTNQKKFTYSSWVKRGNLDSRMTFGLSTFSTVTSYLQFYGWPSSYDDQIYFNNEANSGSTGTIRSNAVFRDAGGWYNIVIVYDSDNGTSGNRLRMYVNGVEITDLGTDTQPSSGSTGVMNKGGITQYLGRQAGTTNYFDGYLSQCCLVDGEALDGTSFGEFDDYGVWRPIDITGLTFGDNGFLLDFADASDLGNDVSGNNNDFSSSGLSSNDQSNDTPTKNYPTFDPNMGRYYTSSTDDATLKNGNLDILGGSSAYNSCDVNFAPLNSGKWYFTWTHNTWYNANNDMGIVNGDCRSGVNGTLTYGYSYSPGAVLVGLELSTKYQIISDDFTNILANLPVTATTSDQSIMAVDIDNLKLWAGFWDQSADNIYWLANDGTWSSADEDVPATGSDETCAIIGDNFTFWSWNYSTSRGGSVDFGAVNGGLLSNFTGPSGFNQINTANLPTPTILDGTAHFQPTLYTGTGSSNEVNQSGNSTFQPDFVWIKNRETTDTNVLTNSVTGATKYNASDSVIALTTNTETLKSFDSDGFTVGTDVIVNTNTEDYVGWSWKGDSSSGVLNEEGSIDSYIAANTTAGFSVVKWTGTGANGTLGHGLTSAPEFIMGRYSNSTGWWHGWHVDLAGATSVFFFNASSAASTDTSAWNSTIPTATLISVGSQLSVNQSGTTCMQYAWHSVDGYSKISSYTGNGSSDGTRVYTGFKPAYIMIKNIGSGSWFIYDSARSPYNEIDDQLLADSNAAETTGSEEIDFLANGFKLRTSDSGVNSSGTVYLFSAFAEYPFGGEETTPSPAY